MMQRHMPMGYQMVNGKITLQEEKAKIIRNIFMDYITGKSMIAIAKKLTAEGILNANNKPYWNHGSVGKILQNVKYQGDELYPSLINKEVFIKVQERRAVIERKLGRIQQLNSMKNQSIFYGKIRCGECGEIYKKYMEHARMPSKKSKWKCKNYISKNQVSCRNLFFTEDELKRIFVDVVNQLIKQKWMLEKVQPKEPPKMYLALRQTEIRIKELEQEGQFSSPELADLIFKRAELYYAGSKIDDYECSTEKIKEAIADLDTLTEFDDELFETIVKHMTVYQEASVKVEFINGIIITNNLEYRRKGGTDGSSKKDGSNYTASSEI